MRLGLMILTTLASALPIVAAAEPVALFNQIEWNSQPVSPPLPDTLNTYLSTINIQGLATMPNQVTVRIPRPNEGVEVTIDLESMDRRIGFVERDPLACDRGDPTGCEIIPIPDFPDDQFSYRWSGRGQG